MFLKLVLDFFTNVGPHTQLPYVRIGVTSMSNSFRAIKTLFLGLTCLSLKNDFKALSYNALMAGLNEPLDENKIPKYV